jgi:hypothetical protein
MVSREIIAACSKIYTKHINILCGQNVEFLNVKPSGTYSNQWARQDDMQRMYTFSAYRAVNTLHLCYKNLSVNAVEG